MPRPSPDGRPSPTIRSPRRSRSATSFELLSKNSKQLKIGVAQLFVINSTLGLLDGIVARGTITPDERSRVIQGARIVLFTVL